MMMLIAMLLAMIIMMERTHSELKDQAQCGTGKGPPKFSKTECHPTWFPKHTAAQFSNTC